MIANLCALAVLQSSPLWIEAAGRRLTLGDAPKILTGDAPHLRVIGLAPGELVVVHAFRSMQKQAFDAKGAMSLATVPMHAWAAFGADRNGGVDLDGSSPKWGSYRGKSPLGLFWSGYPVGDPGIPAKVRQVSFDPGPPSARVFLVLERNGRAADAGALVLSDESPNTAFETVDEPGLNGVFAFPRGGRALRTVISLHGSEGGSLESARRRAESLAARGFATLALNYFAYSNQPIQGVPTANLDTPIEGLERARVWLAARKEADVDRLGLMGVSKGAEFAMVGAATYPWVKAAVGIVPSDVVWEGYGSLGETKRGSSWSLRGTPLAYVPLYGVDPKRFRINTERYEASRRDHPKEAKAAEIPVERSRARFLLLASGRDQVWASAPQARSLARRLPRGRAEVVIFPKAGHFISGTGTFPPRLYGVPSKDPRASDLTAEGAATEEAWNRTIDFLSKNL